MEELNEQLHQQMLGFDSYKRQQWEKQRKPYSVLFELTPCCNLNCIHCYLKDHHGESDYLPYNRVIEIIDILYNMGILFLTLTGGDVFTRKDFRDIYLYAKKKGFFVEIFTNGELISDELIEVFKIYPPLLVDISLYGSNEEIYEKITGKRNAFGRVINVCKKLKDNNIRVTLKTPILKQTISDIPNMQKLADDLGLIFSYSFEIIPTIDGDKSVQNYQLDSREMLQKEFSDFNKLSEAEKNNALLEDYISALEDGMEPPLFTCNIARNSFLVDYKGNICPCMKMRHKGQPLLKDNYKIIWKTYEEYGKMVATKNYKCSHCKARFQCSSCPAEMDALYGDYEHIDEEFCKIAHARYAFYDEHKSIGESLAHL